MIQYLVIPLLTYSPLFITDSSTLITYKNQSESMCSGDLETMINAMLPELPSYANRVIQRARNLKQESDQLHYIILAGKPEFTPLPLTQNQYTPTVEDTTKQVFLTTFERSYFNNKLIETQSYHWLFLTKTNQGWQLVMLFTQLGVNSTQDVLLPPRENSDGIIGQAIKLWLRDCHWEEGSKK